MIANGPARPITAAAGKVSATLGARQSASSPIETTATDVDAGRPAAEPGGRLRHRAGREHSADGHHREMERGDGQADVEVGPDHGHRRADGDLETGQSGIEEVGKGNRAITP